MKMYTFFPQTKEGILYVDECVNECERDSKLCTCSM